MRCRGVQAWEGAVRFLITDHVSGLRTRPRPGRPSFVSTGVMREIWRVARTTTCWTAKGLLDLIRTMSGVEYEISHVVVVDDVLIVQPSQECREHGMFVASVS